MFIKNVLSYGVLQFSNYKFYKIDNFVSFHYSTFYYSTLVHSLEINTHYMKNKFSIKGN